jgi:pyruvate/2-oxoglutarate dehydrogenase complex dihydrolipoamide dehydrogenase (E3) component
MSSAGDAVQAVEQTGAEVYLGHTRFTAQNVVEVDGRQLRFRKAVIATGSDPLLPQIDGLRPGEYLTNENVFSLTELPARLVVIGGGPLACELGTGLPPSRQRGRSHQRRSEPAPNDEPETGELICRRFEKGGLRLHLGYTAVRAGGGQLTVRGADGTRELPYDALLLGTGRKAKVDGLSLEAAGVRLGKDRVEVDEYLRTSNPNIYAAGDVAFPEKFTHAAMATARLCVANALDGANRPARELVIPHCTYTDPEVAQVGLTPMLIAAHAGEMISELTLAITNKMPLEGLANTVHCYPTQAEVFQRIALQ